MLWLAVFQIVGVFVAAWVFYRLLRWGLNRWVRKVERRSRPDHCKCGYALAGLDVARCPECGRVIGFDATAEELGLSQEELRRVQEVRRAREQSR